MTREITNMAVSIDNARFLSANRAKANKFHGVVSLVFAGIGAVVAGDVDAGNNAGGFKLGCLARSVGVRNARLLAQVCRAG
jgi:hypothetical protein